MDRFELVSDLTPKGDQPQAIEALTTGLQEGKKFQTLLGVRRSPMVRGTSFAPPAPSSWLRGTRARSPALA